MYKAKLRDYVFIAALEVTVELNQRSATYGTHVALQTLSAARYTIWKLANVKSTQQYTHTHTHTHVIWACGQTRAKKKKGI
jgi:hypothetical protein